MNDPYFVCETCKVRVEAGYRWATSHLGHDAKIVEYGRSVNAVDVLNYQPLMGRLPWLRNSNGGHPFREGLPGRRVPSLSSGRALAAFGGP